MAGSVMGARTGGKVLLLGTPQKMAAGGSRMSPAPILQRAGKPHCMEGKLIYSIMDLPLRAPQGGV